MTASQIAKSAGLESLVQASRIVNRSSQTLTNWHANYPELFRAVILGCVVINAIVSKECE